MKNKITALGIALAVVLVALGAGLRLYRGMSHSAPPKSDCDIVSQMLEYDKTQGAALSALVTASGDFDDAKYRQMSQDQVKRLQGYADQLSDKSMQTTAQKIVDITGERERVRESLTNGQADAESQMRQEQLKYSQEWQQDVKDLQQSCPSAGGGPSSP